MQNFAFELKTELLKYDLLKHPFYILWNAGLLSIDVLKDYALQYYQQVKNFPRYLSAAHSVTEDIEIRKIFLENLLDEESDDSKKGIVNHVQLWRNFCSGLGLTNQEIDNVEISPKTQALIDTFHELSRKSTCSGLGALYAQEHQYSKISESKRVGLESIYGIADKETIKFFSVHEKVDILHAEQLEKALNSIKDPLEQTGIIEAGKAAMQALNSFLDGMIEKFNLHKLVSSCESSSGA